MTVLDATGGNLGTALYDPYPAPQVSTRYFVPFAKFQNTLVVGAGTASLGLEDSGIAHSRSAYRKDGTWKIYGYNLSPYTKVPTSQPGPFQGSGFVFLPSGRLVYSYLNRPGPLWTDDKPYFMFHDGFAGDLGDTNKGWQSGGAWNLPTPQILASGVGQGRAWILYTLPGAYPKYNNNIGDLYLAFNGDLIGADWEEYLVEPRVLNGVGTCVWLGNEWLVTFNKFESGATACYQKRFSHLPATEDPSSHFVVSGYPFGPAYLALSLSSMALNHKGVLMAFPGLTAGPIPFNFQERYFVSLDRGITWTSYRAPYWYHAPCEMAVSPLYMGGWVAQPLEDTFVAHTSGGLSGPKHRITDCAGIHDGTNAAILAAWPCPT